MDAFVAENYDWLVDSPVEIGTFQESDFDEAGGHFRVIIDADPADYDMAKDRRRTSQNCGRRHQLDGRPSLRYLHVSLSLSARPGGGGMEHAYSTAIDLNADAIGPQLRGSVDGNGARIFPSLERQTHSPKHARTRRLHERKLHAGTLVQRGHHQHRGRRDSVARGLLDEKRYLERLGDEITELKASRAPDAVGGRLQPRRLARRLPLLPPSRAQCFLLQQRRTAGILLDLAVREASQGHASLREVFQWMNQNYAKKGHVLPRFRRRPRSRRSSEPRRSPVIFCRSMLREPKKFRGMIFSHRRTAYRPNSQYGCRCWF